MFISFFPRPRWFLISGVVWGAVCILAWYLGGEQLGAVFGLPPNEGSPIVGAAAFIAPDFIWFYIYYAVASAIFYAFWRLMAPHPWDSWSILGSALILFVTYFQVQVSVAVNTWYGPFYDMVQAALSKSRVVGSGEYFAELVIFAGIAAVAVSVGVLNRFFVSHYVFRWRTAMNEYYVANWGRLRHVEGAAQRVQEDTMRFATTMEDLGVSLIQSVMTLIAFLPVLVRLSVNVTELPLIGEVPQALVLVGLAWSIFGTVFLALIGIKLPGLNFQNQRVEAAYRKELVFGEDDASRAQPPTLVDLFSAVRRNYFRLYFHYMYFNVGRIFYLQIDNIFPWIVLAPTIIAGKITLGPLNQILNSFEQVRSSFQYLVASWTTIIELLSIYKRLRAFEAILRNEPVPPIEAPASASS